MPEQCFRKEDSNPPACGVHNVPLVQRMGIEHADTSEFGDFTYLICPMSGQVVNDSAAHY